MDTKAAPQLGDKCPQCGGEFRERRAPTDAERAAAHNHETGTALPFGVDTATAEDRAKFGALYVCTSCTYPTRMHAADAAERGEQRDHAGA